MTEDEGGGQAPQWADDESATDVFGEDLWEEVRDVCSEARRLLGAEVPGGHGHAGTARVCLDIEKGLLLTAQYLVAHEHFGGDWPRLQQALEGKGKDGRAARAALHERLAGFVRAALRKELDDLAMGQHRILRAVAEKRGWRLEKPPAGS